MIEPDSVSAKVALITNDTKHAMICVIPDVLGYPLPAVIKNNLPYKVGQIIKLRKDIKVSERSKEGYTYCVFEKGVQNFKPLPEFYKATVKYVSDSGKYVAVSVRINGHSDSVLAFFPRPENAKKGEIIEIPTSLCVYPVTKEDDSTFYFFKDGLCNFIIHTSVRSTYSADQDWSDYDQSREDYYQELGNSVCEYCGDYHCDCQRSLDEQYDNL